MAFKPYCYECQTWHTEAEGHVAADDGEQDHAEISDEECECGEDTCVCRKD